MAVIEWDSQAWQLYNDLLENGRLEFGEKTARRWETEIVDIYNRLKIFPTSYTPESLLKGKSRLYRGCHLMHRRFKLIYYYDEAEDIVHILDIWDTKMNPKALIRRIK